MDQTEREVIQRKVVELTESLRNFDPGSKEFENTVKAITDLASKVNDSLKIDLEDDYRVCSAERADKLKEREIEAKIEHDNRELDLKERDLECRVADEKARRRTNLIIEGGKAFVEICGIVIPLKCYYEFMKMGFNFEKTNIISSQTFRNLLRFIKPRK